MTPFRWIDFGCFIGHFLFQASVFALLCSYTYTAIAFLGTALCVIYCGYFLGHRSYSLASGCFSPLLGTDSAPPLAILKDEGSYRTNLDTLVADMAS